MGKELFKDIHNHNVCCISIITVDDTFICISGAGTDSFSPEDAFVGYQSDTPASIVFKVWQDLKLDEVEFSKNDDQWEEKVCVYVYSFSVLHNTLTNELLLCLLPSKISG